MNIKDTRDFFLVEEIADKLRVSNMTIYRYIKDGKLTAYKLGKEFRIKKEDFDSFINNAKV